MVTVKVTIREQTIQLFPDQASWLREVFDRFKIKYNSVSYCSELNKEGHFFVEYEKYFSRRALNAIKKTLNDACISYEELTMEEFVEKFKKKDVFAHKGIGGRAIDAIDDVFEMFGIDWPGSIHDKY